MTGSRPTLEALTALAGGRLSPPLALLVETMQAMRGVPVEDVAGGAFLEAEAPAPMRADALERAFAAIDSEPSPRQAARAVVPELGDILSLPEPVRAASVDALAEGDWRFAGPGVRRLPLVVEGKTKAELMRIEPGRGVPTHGHHGAEFTLVLRGAFSDERGRYGPGDLCEGGPGVEHRPIAEAGEVCYALVVSEAPPAFKGALGVLQRLLTKH
jgi:putative transcriptional regulator